MNLKKFQYWSTETLKSKREGLCAEIRQWENVIVNAKSLLVQLSLSHYIKKAKEEIHAIDAELCYREKSENVHTV